MNLRNVMQNLYRITLVQVKPMDSAKRGTKKRCPSRQTVDLETLPACRLLVFQQILQQPDPFWHERDGIYIPSQRFVVTFKSLETVRTGLQNPSGRGQNSRPEPRCASRTCSTTIKPLSQNGVIFACIEQLHASTGSTAS